jgi:hypothetical protein
MGIIGSDYIILIFCLLYFVVFSHYKRLKAVSLNSAYGQHTPQKPISIDANDTELHRSQFLHLHVMHGSIQAHSHILLTPQLSQAYYIIIHHFFLSSGYSQQRV